MRERGPRSFRRCPACGYDLAGIRADICPECGGDPASHPEPSLYPLYCRAFAGPVALLIGLMWLAMIGDYGGGGWPTTVLAFASAGIPPFFFAIWYFAFAARRRSWGVDYAFWLHQPVVVAVWAVIFA